MSVAYTVVGEALVDLVEDPVTPQVFTAHAGGSPFNTAVTLGRLGAAVSLVARRGPDGFGALLEAKLRDSGVELARWTVGREPTTLAVATVDPGGQARYGFYLDGTAALEWDESLAGAAPTAGVLHLGSLASWRDGSAAAVHALQRRAHGSGDVLVSYDPNLRPALVDDLAATRAQVEACVAAAHLVKASDEDVEFLYPGSSPDEVAARWCAAGAGLVVVTRGGDGAVAYGPAGEVAARPALPITVVDTVGAGDSFAGGLLAALGAAGLAHPAALRAAAAERDPRLAEALTEAVTVSAITCERAGANPPTAAELRARLAAPGRPPLPPPVG